MHDLIGLTEFDAKTGPVSMPLSMIPCKTFFKRRPLPLSTKEDTRLLFMLRTSQHTPPIGPHENMGEILPKYRFFYLKNGSLGLILDFFK